MNKAFSRNRKQRFKATRFYLIIKSRYSFRVAMAMGLVAQSIGRINMIRASKRDSISKPIAIANDIVKMNVSIHKVLTL